MQTDEGRFAVVCLQQLDFLAEQSTQGALARHLFLRKLRMTHPAVFIRLLRSQPDRILPLVYTPTIGLVCQVYHQLPIPSFGLHLRIDRDRGRVEEAISAFARARGLKAIRIVVVTDGERVLGLGDLGCNGLGISEGKILLYSAIARIPEENCLPVCLDVGTNNSKLLEDPQYPGVRAPRSRYASGYDDFVAEFVQALQHISFRQCQNMFLQWEDFGRNNAFRLLDIYRDRLPSFNDDIQGTAAVVLTTVFSAARRNRCKISSMKFVIVGAGEAGLGIADVLSTAIHLELEKGDHDERVPGIAVMDSKGLITTRRRASNSRLDPHKAKYAVNLPDTRSLEDVIKLVKPSVLIGCCAIPNTFTPSVLSSLNKNSEVRHPLILPLSNPSSLAECTPSTAKKYCPRSLFAAGSPFPEDNSEMANNAYIFPALGAACAGFTFKGDSLVSMTNSSTINIGNEMLVHTAKLLSNMASEDRLLPDLMASAPKLMQGIQEQQNGNPRLTPKL